MRRSFRHPSSLYAAIVLAALVALTSAAPAGAHITRGDDWYFYGNTYRNESPPRNRVDPVNVLWFGGSSSSYNATDVLGHYHEWVAGDDRMSERWCKSSQRMIWRDLRGNRTSDREDRHAMQNCEWQYHSRMWDDQEHRRLVGGSHTLSWVVTPTHHERCCPHKPDRDWDDVRVAATKGLKQHCSYPLWRYHPGADDTYAGMVNSGWVARISMRHTSGGCGGA